MVMVIILVTECNQKIKKECKELGEIGRINYKHALTGATIKDAMGNYVRIKKVIFKD